MADVPVVVTEIREDIERLERAAHGLRDRFNYRRRLRDIGKNPERFNTICAAMDVVGDCCLALTGYLDHLDTAEDDAGLNYLVIYGVMNALYIQQDAMFFWGKYLNLSPYAGFAEPGNWATTIPELNKARTARNDATGHPSRRTKGKSVSAFFISRMSVDRDGFSLMETKARARSEFRDVMLLDLIAEQVPTLAKLLEEACTTLDALDREHYRRFMDKPLSQIFDKLTYPLSKLSTTRDQSDWPMMPIVIPEIQERLVALKKAIEARGEPFDDVWLDPYKRLHYTLGLLRKYVTDPPSFDERLADVLCRYVQFEAGHLRNIAAEIDERYRTGADKS